jgi:hypothetical protein
MYQSTGKFPSPLTEGIFDDAVWNKYYKTLKKKQENATRRERKMECERIK